MERPTLIGRLIGRVAPGLRHLMGYRREWLRPDLMAGVSVAAVAIPTAIAYAQLIGFEPVVGLYAAILPLVAYTRFGTSRQLIVNPDAATCAVFAAAVLPLAGGDRETLSSLSVVLSVFTGLICIAAGIFRLGFVADFLAKPILIGYLNGVAISIFSRPDRQSVRLRHAIAGHHPATHRVCGAATSDPSTDTRHRLGDSRGHHGEQARVASGAGERLV
jgi:MFS superfamily sulfate permease-like transporter